MVRVFLYYSNAQGALLASGLAFQAIFAVFAAVWVTFSVIGLVVAGDAHLQKPLIDFLADNVPGLIKSSSGSGAIDPKVLLSAGTFTFSGLIALAGVLITAVGWLGSARTAIRIIFGVPQSKTNFFLLKLRDLGVALGFSLALIVSAALSVAGSAATGFGLDLLGISPHSLAANIAGKSVTITLSFFLDAAILGALKVLGGSLLGVSKSNPLLASFAVILGLLIFFNFVCQVILLSASWVSVAVDDRGLELGAMDHSRRLTEPADVGTAQ